MKVSVKSSGGFANIELGGQIDTVDLPAELAEAAERVLTKENLGKAAAAPRDPHVADSMLYEVTLHGAGDEPSGTYAIDDVAADSEIGETLAALMSEVLRRRREGTEVGEEE